MAWLGLGKKNRLTNGVIQEMYGLFEHYGVPKDNATTRDLNSQIKQGDPIATYHDALMQGFYLVIEDKLDEMIKMKYTPRQGAIWCFSSYIVNVNDSGNLEKLQQEDPDLFLALKVIWFICNHHLKQDPLIFNSCVSLINRTAPDDVPDLKKDFGF